MSSRPELKLDWCSYEAAKYAVEKWHYSRCLPSFKLVKIGVWENRKFIGCVIFSLGAAPQASCPYQINRNEICELTRVALTQHETPVTRIVSVALKMLKLQSPGIRLVVSYADPEQNHHGGIYAGGNWIYVGHSNPCEHYEWCDTGKRVHSKTIKTGRRGYTTKLKAQGAIRSVMVWKHKYLMPLDDAMRRQIEPLRKPYPKRAGSIDNDAAAVQAAEGGANPTPALQATAGLPSAAPADPAVV